MVTALDNHPKFQFYFKKGSSKKFPMSIAPMSRQTIRVYPNLYHKKLWKMELVTEGIKLKSKFLAERVIYGTLGSKGLTTKWNSTPHRHVSRFHSIFHQTFHNQKELLLIVVNRLSVHRIVFLPSHTAYDSSCLNFFCTFPSIIPQSIFINSWINAWGE